jgi:hypothetical protein
MLRLLRPVPPVPPVLVYALLSGSKPLLFCRSVQVMRRGKRRAHGERGEHGESGEHGHQRLGTWKSLATKPCESAAHAACPSATRHGQFQRVFERAGKV